MTPIELVLSKLEGVRQRDTSWEALCPAHQDRRQSLYVSVGQDGRVLLKCRACCEISAVVAGMGLKMRDLFPQQTSSKPSLGRIVATYGYPAANGELAFQVLRYENKGFRQRRPDGRGGWIWNISGITPIPYRLPELLAAIHSGATIYIPEGEKDVDNLISLGLGATCNSGGAGKWIASHAGYLDGAARVVILPDNDVPGEEHARKVARTLVATAGVEEIRILNLPGLPNKGDVSDWIRNGGTREELERLVAEAPLWRDGHDPPTAGESAPKHSAESASANRGRKAANASTALIDLVLGFGVDLFHTPEGESYASLPVGGHRETWAIRSTGFKEFVSRLNYQTTGGTVSSDSQRDALATLAGLARFDGAEHPVYTRLASHEGKIYLNLCDATWRVVEIAESGWQLVSQAPVHFRRPKGMQPLPVPVQGHSIDLLRPFVNVADDDDFRLFVSWLVQALRPVGPYPLLEIHGEQGCAKSTTARIARSLVDPSTVPLRSEPKEPRDLMINAKHAHVIAIDNLSGIPGWLSDALCRLSTGGGFGTRGLYSDDDESLFDAQRPAILTGIGEIVCRPDLMDRSIIMAVTGLPDVRRRTETEFWEAFRAVQPAILGALLTAVSSGLGRHSQVVLSSLPRMADFAVWMAAAEPGLGWPAGSFMTAYTTNRAEGNRLALESSPIGSAIRELVEALPNGTWEGTASELKSALEQLVSESVKAQKEWPRNARSLSVALKRIAPNLRSERIEVTLPAKGTGGSRVLRLAGGANLSPAGVCASPTQFAPPACSHGTDASGTNDANSAASLRFESSSEEEWGDDDSGGAGVVIEEMPEFAPFAPLRHASGSEWGNSAAARGL